MDSNRNFGRIVTKAAILQSEMLVLAGLILLPMRTYAIPALSRKYETSCVTCHAVYPRLNQFGEAIRLNGLRWPGNGEPQNTKEKPISLGAPSYKQVWPKSVWPGSIPGTVPIAFRIKQGYDIVAKGDSSNPGFTQPEIELLAGGTFGDDISFWITAGLLMDGEAGEIEQAFLSLDKLPSLWLPSKNVHLKLGQFLPETVPFINKHRSLTINSYLFNTYVPSASDTSTGPSSFSFETAQLGMEFNGILKGRLRYVLGMVNGNGTGGNDNSMDVYYRISYKYGGLGLDGVRPKDLSGEAEIKKMEHSLNVGIFGYFGTATSEGHKTAVHRFGVDCVGLMGGATFFSGLLTGANEEYLGDELLVNRYTLFLCEGSYLLYPWLAGSIRYERAYPEQFDSVARVVPGITALYTANVKFLLEGLVNPANKSEFTLQAGMDFAF